MSVGVIDHKTRKGMEKGQNKAKVGARIHRTHERAWAYQGQKGSWQEQHEGDGEGVEEDSPKCE